MDPADVESALRGLAERVRVIEERLDLRAAAPVAAQVLPPGAGADAGPDLLPTLGRSLLGLAGAYLLRALVESETVPTQAGVVLGILYAIGWLVWAARTPAECRLEAALHALTSGLVLAPLLWEATVRFQAVSTWTAAFTLLAFTVFGLAISWRKNLLIVATIATLAGFGCAAALLIATHDVLPFTFVFLAAAAAIEVSACLDHWLSERWLAAAAADLAVLLATWLVTNPRGLPAGYAPIPHGWLMTAQIALLGMYLASTIVRTLFRHFTFTAFEIAQCAAAFAIVMSGGLQLSPALLVCGAACYAVSFLVLGRGGWNFYGYSTFGLVLTLAASRALLAGTAAPAVWSLLAIACAWSRPLTLQAHGAVYLLLALVTAGDLVQSPAAVLVAAICYLGAARGPLRIPMFAAAVWVFANFAGVVAPPALRLAVKLVIFGGALILLPRIKAGPAAANRAAGSSDSETTPRPRDSEAKSGTASGAA